MVWSELDPPGLFSEVASRTPNRSRRYGIMPEEENAVAFLLMVCFLSALFVHPYLNNKTVAESGKTAQSEIGERCIVGS